MADVGEAFKAAWSQALVGLNTAEQEAEKLVARFADAASFGPDDVRRQVRELAERLQAQRKEIERNIDEAVRRTTARFRPPSRDEVEALRQRLEALAARVDALAAAPRQEGHRP
jgi:poly(hydroxyalkanoate) granule-associated protein